MSKAEQIQSILADTTIRLQQAEDTRDAAQAEATKQTNRARACIATLDLIASYLERRQDHLESITPADPTAQAVKDAQLWEINQLLATIDGNGGTERTDQ